MHIIVGPEPASCAAADPGLVLAVMVLPADWAANAVAGAKAKVGVWQDTSADAAGLAGHFRIYDSTGTTCGMQGSITATGGGGNLELDNPLLVVGQQVTITGFTTTEGNA
jgi:hypothetical protein